MFVLGFCIRLDDFGMESWVADLMRFMTARRLSSALLVDVNRLIVSALSRHLRILLGKLLDISWVSAAAWPWVNCTAMSISVESG